MTRTSLQMIAEHLLSADLHAHTGRIGLRRTPGGFGQPEFTVDGERRRLRVDHTSLALLEGDTERWTPLTTIGELAEFAGVEPGAPETVFTPSTALSPDQPLEVDPAATADLALFFATVEEALEALRSANPGHTPAMVQLWPEHFDLATNMSEVNFGGSPAMARSTSPTSMSDRGRRSRVTSGTSPSVPHAGSPGSTASGVLSSSSARAWRGPWPPVGWPPDRNAHDPSGVAGQGRAEQGRTTRGRRRCGHAPERGPRSKMPTPVPGPARRRSSR
ncbi:MAG: hypothetical protein R2714_05935 [Microthrixaceae bacterium]